MGSAHTDGGSFHTRSLIDGLRADVDELRAENSRLRAALEEIRLHADGQVTQYARARGAVASIARAALNPEED